MYQEQMIEGANAFSSGVKRFNNPYSPFGYSGSRQAWFSGYDKAAEQYVQRTAFGAWLVMVFKRQLVRLGNWLIYIGSR